MPLSAHGEGPVWDARQGLLRWVDMVAGEVHHVDPQRVETHGVARVGSWAAAFRPRVHGGWVVATDTEFVVTDAAFAVECRIPVIDDARLRFNDGGCTVDGAFLCGTAGPDGAGSLYRLTPDLDVSVLADGITISNGLAADPRGGGVFYVDTATRRIDRLHLVDGALAERAVFADLAEEPGLPDGIAVDVEGGVWVAMWGAGEMIRMDPDGGIDLRITLPTPHVSACTFGGADMNELFITTSRQGLAVPDDNAGAVFVARPGITGVPVLPFQG